MTKLIFSVYVVLLQYNSNYLVLVYLTFFQIYFYVKSSYSLKKYIGNGYSDIIIMMHGSSSYSNLESLLVVNLFVDQFKFIRFVCDTLELFFRIFSKDIVTQILCMNKILPDNRVEVMDYMNKIIKIYFDDSRKSKAQISYKIR